MYSLLKFSILLAYWIFLTKSLLVSCPWELFSSHLAAHPPFDLSFEPVSWVTHLMAYATLGGLIHWTSFKKYRKLYFFLLAAGLFHSVACELLQTYVPGRWPNSWDALSNTLGLIAAFALRKTPEIHFPNFFWNIFPKKPVA